MINLSTTAESTSDTQHLFLNQNISTFAQEQIPQLISIAASVAAGMALVSIGSTVGLTGFTANLALNSLGGVLAGDAVSYIAKHHFGYVNCSSIFETAHTTEERIISYGQHIAENMLLSAAIGMTGNALRMMNIKEIQFLAHYLSIGGTGFIREAGEEYAEYFAAMGGQFLGIPYCDNFLAVFRAAKGRGGTSVLEKINANLPQFKWNTWGPVGAFGLLGAILFHSNPAMADAGGLAAATSAIGAAGGAGIGAAARYAFSKFKRTNNNDILKAPVDPETIHPDRVRESLRAIDLTTKQIDELLRLAEAKTDDAKMMSLNWLARTSAQIPAGQMTPDQTHGFFKIIIESKDDIHMLSLTGESEEMAQIAGAFKDMAAYGFTLDEQLEEAELLLDCFEKINDEDELNAGLIFQTLFDVTRRGTKPEIRRKIFYFNQILLCLNRHNATPVLNLLSEFQGGLDLTPRETMTYLRLFAHVFRRWPRLGYNILDGLVSGNNDYKINNEKMEKILFFVAETHSFVPFLYKKYSRSNGMAFSWKLKADAKNIFEGRMTHDDFVEKMEERDGRDYVLGIMQAVWPSSGSSFIGRDAMEERLDEMLEVGVVAWHIPEKLRNVDFDFTVEIDQPQSRNSQTGEKINRLTSWLGEESTDTLPSLSETIGKYLGADTRSKAEKAQAVVRTLCQYASTLPGYRERIEVTDGHPVRTIGLLEKIFTDSRFLPKFMQRAMAGVDLSSLSTPIQRADNVAGSLKGIWESAADLPTKQQRIASALKSYATDGPMGIRETLLTRGDLSEELKSEIATAMESRNSDSDREKITSSIVTNILREPLGWIRQERGRIRAEVGELEMALRMRKGPGDTLHGITGGRCTADNVKLWADPNYLPIAIANKTDGVNMGDIVGYQIEIDGRRILTLPGINPAAEFLGVVDPEVLYDKMINALWQMADREGYEEIYIPTDEAVFSNRPEIREIVRRKGYEKRRIPRVNWIDDPADYTFDEVYVVPRPK